MNITSFPNGDNQTLNPNQASVMDDDYDDSESWGTEWDDENLSENLSIGHEYAEIPEEDRPPAPLPRPSQAHPGAIPDYLEPLASGESGNLQPSSSQTADDFCSKPYADNPSIVERLRSQLYPVLPSVSYSIYNDGRRNNRSRPKAKYGRRSRPRATDETSFQIRSEVSSRGASPQTRPNVPSRGASPQTRPREPTGETSLETQPNVSSDETYVPSRGTLAETLYNIDGNEYIPSRGIVPETLYDIDGNEYIRSRGVVPETFYDVDGNEYFTCLGVVQETIYDVEGNEYIPSKGNIPLTLLMGMNMSDLKHLGQ